MPSIAFVRGFLRRTNPRPPEPRLFLLEMAPKGSVCAEIGVWQGDFSARILDLVKPSKLHLIDPWQFVAAEPYRQARYGGGWAHEQADMDGLYDSVLRRFASPIARGSIQVHRSTSEAAAVEFQDSYFDWIYIDGNHLYEFVRRDLELYLPTVKSGGLIAGDDYGETGWWEDGVTRAVDEFVGSGHCRLVLTRAGQFVLRKPEAAEAVKGAPASVALERSAL